MLGISEIFYSIQGEGFHVGRAAVFVRLSGCNLNCSFCDTDFSLREMCSIETIVERVDALDSNGAFVILTGGEPLAQTLTLSLIDAFLARGRAVHIESNGTIALTLPAACWLTVSPKERATAQMLTRADELKLIVDRRIPTEWLGAIESNDKQPIFLQPEGNKPENVAIAIAAIQAAPKRFRLSLQTHKFINVR